MPHKTVILRRHRDANPAKPDRAAMLAPRRRPALEARTKANRDDARRDETVRRVFAATLGAEDAFRRDLDREAIAHSRPLNGSSAKVAYRVTEPTVDKSAWDARYRRIDKAGIATEMTGGGVDGVPSYSMMGLRHSLDPTRHSRVPLYDASGVETPADAYRAREIGVVHVPDTSPRRAVRLGRGKQVSRHLRARRKGGGFAGQWATHITVRRTWIMSAQARVDARHRRDMMRTEAGRMALLRVMPERARWQYGIDAMRQAWMRRVFRDSAMVYARASLARTLARLREAARTEIGPAVARANARASALEESTGRVTHRPEALTSADVIATRRDANKTDRARNLRARGDIQVWRADSGGQSAVLRKSKAPESSETRANVNVPERTLSESERSALEARLTALESERAAFLRVLASRRATEAAIRRVLREARDTLERHHDTLVTLARLEGKTLVQRSPKAS